MAAAGICVVAGTCGILAVNHFSRKADLALKYENAPLVSKEKLLAFLWDYADRMRTVPRELVIYEPGIRLNQFESKMYEYEQELYEKYEVTNASIATAQTKHQNDTEYKKVIEKITDAYHSISNSGPREKLISLEKFIEVCEALSKAIHKVWIEVEDEVKRNGFSRRNPTFQSQVMNLVTQKQQAVTEDLLEEFGIDGYMLEAGTKEYLPDPRVGRIFENVDRVKRDSLSRLGIRMNHRGINTQSSQEEGRISSQESYEGR